MANYNSYSIVAEEQCVCVQKPASIPNLSRDELYKNREFQYNVFSISTQQTSWEFSIQYDGTLIERVDVKNIHKLPIQPMVAEIVMWHWNKSNSQEILRRFLFNQNESKNLITQFYRDRDIIENDVHFIIRLLGYRKLVKDLCPPLDYLPSSDTFTISVGDQNFVVSAQRLMQVSPVFRAMLTDEMREKAERKVEVKDAHPEHFRAFLEVIDPDQTVQPSPYSVAGVLKLADRYQVNLAKERCEGRLLNCVELPLIEHLQLADTYGLNKLKASILSIGSVKLRVLYKANLDKFKKGQFSNAMLHELTSRICDNE